MNVRSFALALALAGPAVVAHAGIPSPATSTVPAHIVLVGQSVSGADSALGRFTVICRHLSGDPWAEGPVWVDCSGCPDCRVSSAPMTGQTRAASCPGSSGGITPQADGSVTFTLTGGSTGHPGTAGPATARIIADGVLLGTVPIAIYDLDSAGGVGASDLGLWLADFGSGQYIGRDDYDFDGTLGADDLSLWLSAFGAGGSALSGMAICP